MFSHHRGTRGAVLFLCLTSVCGPWVRATDAMDAMDAIDAMDAPEVSTPPPVSRIEGKVLRSNGNTPMAGAIVSAFHLDTGKVYTSKPSDPSGEFEVEGLPYGYVDLSVETPEGVFVGNVVVNVPPGGSVGLRFSLTPYSERPGELPDDRSRDAAAAPGKAVAGVAEIRTRPRGREFWKSPAGIAVIGGSGGAVLLGIAAGGGGKQAASPSSP